MLTKIKNENMGSTIIRDLNNKIDAIKSIEYHYNLENIFKSIQDMDQDEKDITYQSIINYYLEQIFENTTLDNIRKIEQDTHTVTEYFDYDYCIDTQVDRKKSYILSDEAENVIYDLVDKVFGKGGRFINLPIDLDDIKKYCISSIIIKDDIDKVIMWIIMKLSVIYSFTVNK